MEVYLFLTKFAHVIENFLDDINYYFESNYNFDSYYNF